MRIRHIGVVTSDLQRAASFYEDVFGFKRLGAQRTPGHYPGRSIDLTDGEVDYSLLCPDERVATSPGTQGTLGPNHVGVELEDTAHCVEALRGYDIEIYGEDKDQSPPRFFSSATRMVSSSMSQLPIAAGNSDRPRYEAH